MNKKGFTLIEMLVVIAIIAVLVSIVIPVVGNSTEKAKEAADAANIRAAIAEVTTSGLTNEGTKEKVVTLTQTGDFDTNTDLTNIGGFPLTAFNNQTSVTIKYTDAGVTVGNKTVAQWGCTTFVDNLPAASEGGTAGDGKCDNCGQTQDAHASGT